MFTASASRQFARAALRTSARHTLATTSRQGGRRAYSEIPQPPESRAFMFGVYAISAAIAGGGAYYVLQTTEPTTAANTKFYKPARADYQKIYDEIARRLEEKDDYDDGSFGPVLVRLAWHASGTFDKETGTGGSDGATMRFAPEGDHGANAGLKHARDFLEPIKAKYPWITYSDLWILAGVCAIQEMQGPTIPYRPGRSDKDAAACTPDGRLPDGSKGANHLRDIFYRMGFDDQEIVALSGAHALGRCHTDRSGYDGPWTFSPTVLTNDFYTLLLNEKWHIRKWDGPQQYQDKTKGLMMLPSDYALIQDKAMKPWVEKYAKDNDLFFKDFAAVVTKLFELGVRFKPNTETIVFKPSNA